MKEPASADVGHPYRRKVLMQLHQRVACGLSTYSTYTFLKKKFPKEIAPDIRALMEKIICIAGWSVQRLAIG